MTRLASTCRHRLCEIQTSFIWRPPDDRRLGSHLLKSVNVLQCAYATRSNHGAVGSLDDGAKQLGVGCGEGSVSTDVRHQKSPDPGVDQPLCQLRGRLGGGSSPTSC